MSKEIIKKDEDIDLLLNNILGSIQESEQHIIDKNEEILSITKEIKNKSFIWTILFFIKNYFSKLKHFITFIKSQLIKQLTKTGVSNISAYFTIQTAAGSILPAIFGFFGYAIINQTIKINNIEIKLKQANEEVIVLQTKAEELEKQKNELLAKIDRLALNGKPNGNFGAYVINLKDGEQLSGVITKKDQENVYLKLPDNSIRKVSNEDIYSLVAK